MATTRNKTYFANKKTNPITSKQEVQQSNDNKIDQDFPGFPHGHSKEDIIQPKNATDAATADVNNKDGEKRLSNDHHADELTSDGSGNAFTATEEVKE